jgi:hypothetical protein
MRATSSSDFAGTGRLDIFGPLMAFD